MKKLFLMLSMMLLPMMGYAEGEDCAPLFCEPACCCKCEPITDPISVAFSTPIASKYIFRGINLVDDWVWQPSITLGYKDLSLTVFTNWNTTNEPYSGIPNVQWKLSEVDILLSYTFSWCKWSLTGWLIDYEFPNTPFDRQPEVAATIAYDTYFSPSFMAYYEVGLIKGWVFKFMVHHTFADLWNPWCDVMMSADIAAHVEYSTSEWLVYWGGPSKSSWEDVFLSLSLPFQIGKHMTLSPSFQGSWLLSHYRDAPYKADNFIFKLDAVFVW